MSIYIIGDLHLSLNPSVEKPMDIYGGVWVNHWKNLMEYWDKNIKDEDTIIIAGDISWAMKLQEAMHDLKWISDRKGKKILLKGNHDLWWSGINKMRSLFENIDFLQGNYICVQGVGICGTRGWVCPGSEFFTEQDEKLYKRELLRLETSLKSAKNDNIEEIIGVLHYPPTNEKKQLSGFTNLFETYGVKKVFYGHLHNEDAKRNKEAININGVSYKLISFDAVDGIPLKIL